MHTPAHTPPPPAAARTRRGSAWRQRGCAAAGPWPAGWPPCERWRTCPPGGPRRWRWSPGSAPGEARPSRTAQTKHYAHTRPRTHARLHAPSHTLWCSSVCLLAQPGPALRTHHTTHASVHTHTHTRFDTAVCAFSHSPDQALHTPHTPKSSGLHDPLSLRSRK